MDELEAYLVAQNTEGELDSSVQFTMDRDKALAKLSQFQLPGDHHWAYKIVQAVVAGGSAGLEIQLSLTGSQFLFEDLWTLDELEAAFFEPEPSPSAALNHCKQALWSVSYAGMRPFQFAPAQSKESLIWTGTGFRRVATKAESRARLVVSHRTRQQEQNSWLVVREIEALRANSALGNELRRVLFMCPFPVALDGVRLDAIQHCPVHGVGQKTHPLKLAFEIYEGPALTIPPGTFAYKPVVQKGLAPELYSLPPPGFCRGCATLVAARFDLGIYREFSLFYWVVDGVVVVTERLPHEGAVSAAVFASAAGLPTDLSGFSLRDCPEKTERKRAVMEALAPTIKSLTLDLQKKIAEARAASREWGALGLGMSALFLGLGMFFTIPVPAVMGLVVGGAGVRSLLKQGSVMLDIREELRHSLLELQQLWPDGLVRNPLDEIALQRPKGPATPEKAVEGPQVRQPKWRQRRGQ